MMRTLLAAALGGLASAIAAPAWSIEPGTQRHEPVAVSAADPLRQALVVVPGGVSGPVGSTASDGDAYEAVLRLLGFRVTTVSVASRPELDAGLRDFAAGVAPDDDVAVFVLGTAMARGDELYITPTLPSAETVSNPDLYGTEGLSVSDVLRRVADRHPRDIALVVDSCKLPAGEGACRIGPASFPDGVSALVASRTTPQPGSEPVSRAVSLKPDLLPLMEQQGLSFVALYGALERRLAGTDLSLTATPSLSRNFAFLPQGFFEHLPTACNAVDPALDETSLRHAPLDPLIAACTEAEKTYDFNAFFQNKLATVREQKAFQNAVADCAAVGVEDTYLDAYPSGPHRGAVESFKARCIADRGRPSIIAPQGAVSPAAKRPASFACTPFLVEPIAQLICSDVDLSDADGRLGEVYRSGLAALTDPAERRAFTQEERTWIAHRNASCSLPNRGNWSLESLGHFKPCVLAVTRMRTHELAP